ncbi:ovostatin-like [Tupaia chinensis]|uniref:ovostatin-like n=1 Tax=Tupaia chinensis TaxID=246437 RepID=UPI000FFBF340|nr:ovostatin-like [Tupaia chinensis]
MNHERDFRVDDDKTNLHSREERVDLLEMQYVLLVPSVLHEASSGRACAQLLNLTEPVVLTVFLNYDEVQIYIFEEKVIEENFFQCFSFEVPPARSDPLAFITFSAKGATLHLEERRSVAISPRENVVLVQTDKPIYKPGQNVRFRVLTLDDHLKPVDETRRSYYRSRENVNKGMQEENLEDVGNSKNTALLSHSTNTWRLQPSQRPSENKGDDNENSWSKDNESWYPVITLTDPQGNRIQQWVNEESVRGIIQLSFQLISEPILGWYQITVETFSEKKIYQSFSVEEYGYQGSGDFGANTKKLSWCMADAAIRQLELSCPPHHYLSRSTCRAMTVREEVYTYGKPVDGKVLLSVCRKPSFYGDCKYLPTALCKNFTTQLRKDGCVSQFISTDGFELHREGYWSYLHVNVHVTENGTGEQLTRFKSINIDSSMVKITFENMDTFYKQGLPYFGQIKLLHPDNSPIPNEVIQLHLKDKIVGNYTTDANGTAHFSLDTSKFTYPNITLKATYKASENCKAEGWVLPQYPQPEYFVPRFYSKTNSFLKIVPEIEELKCNQRKQVMVHYLLNMEDFKDRTYTAVFNYLVISKGAIILHGQQEIVIHDNAKTGTFSVPVEVSVELAPSAVMLVYSLHPAGEMITDSTRFEIEKCFNHEVNLKFSKEKSLPGSNISLQVSAAPHSLCALWGVDQSILLLRSYGQLSAQSVYNQLHYKDLYGYYFKGLNLEDGPKMPCLQNEHILYNGIYYKPVWADFGQDAYDLVKAMGLKVFTNSHLRKPVLCEDSRHRGCDDQHGYDYIDYGYACESCSTGKADLSLTVPDTITQWKTNGLCMSDRTGFGISPTNSLTAFQPFFVELTFPYSVVRGEAFILKANTFNHLNRCIEINTVLRASRGYQARPLSTEDKNVCTCSSEKRTFTWLMTPQILGAVNLTVTAETLPNNGCENGSPKALDIGWRDTVIKPLLVEPEGIEKEMTQGSLICTSGSTVSQPVVLTLPENLVKDSARAYFSVLGDILGSAMQNLQSLLRMPFGCGEQNMALFTPTVYVLDYLGLTEQLTEEIKSKAIGYLTQGYQKQLSYKHLDGSYSTFGYNDGQGNTWLTAFVYKSFAQANRYIYIDDKVQSQTLIWLLSIQKSDGCFQNLGYVFNNALKNEEENEISLTAYVINALLEAGHPVSFLAIQKGLRCLEAASGERALTAYDQALLAYTYSLVNYKDKRDFFVNELRKKAKKVGGTVHWELKEHFYAEGSSFFYPRARSADIEVTCYALLALLSKSGLTSEELSYTSQIVQWVARQQNSYGGFSSTKDTVVALQALTLFQRLTFSRNSQNSVHLFSDRAFSTDFHTNDENRLLLQQIPLPTTQGNYTLEVNGNGCVYVQTTLRYNILLPKKSSGFSLSVSTANASCRALSHAKFDLVVSASYHGRRSSSNMAIIDVKMLSGYVPDRLSVKKVQNSMLLAKMALE